MEIDILMHEDRGCCIIVEPIVECSEDILT